MLGWNHWPSFKGLVIGNLKIEKIESLYFPCSWFFKYTEVHRALLLREHIDVFFDTFDVPATLNKIEEEDWKLLLVSSCFLKLPFYLFTTPGI